MVQSLQVRRNIYISAQAWKTPQIVFLFIWQSMLIGPFDFWRTKKNAFSVLQNIFSLLQMKVSTAEQQVEGVQNVWINLLIFKFIVLRLVIYSVSVTILEPFVNFLIDLGYIQFGHPNLKLVYVSISKKYKFFLNLFDKFPF